MGKYDRCMKAYLQDKRRFADFFNGSCFQGRQVIRAEDLEEASGELCGHGGKAARKATAKRN